MLYICFCTRLPTQVLWFVGQKVRLISWQTAHNKSVTPACMWNVGHFQIINISLGKLLIDQVLLLQFFDHGFGSWWDGNIHAVSKTNENPWKCKAIFCKDTRKERIEEIREDSRRDRRSRMWYHRKCKRVSRSYPCRVALPWWLSLSLCYTHLI